MTCNNFDTNLIVSPYFTWFPDCPFEKLRVNGEEKTKANGG
ncbi:MAG: hypothetical protein K0S36_406 [Nitrosospira multiformis]|jgi:hypothetical protein|nr:hypothetical protein [Nitrosospira multiformis]